MERDELIQAITELKQTEIMAGFDFPSQDINEATTAELRAFHEELKLYLSEQKKL